MFLDLERVEEHQGHFTKACQKSGQGCSADSQSGKAQLPEDENIVESNI